MAKGRTYKGDLRELIQEFSRLVLDNEKIYSQIAKVLSVDESEKTCVVEVIDGAEIEGVRLQQLAGDSGFLMVPTIDSLVIISYTDKTTAYVSMFSYIDKVIFQGGNNGGLTITPELVTNLDKNNAILTDLLNVITGAPIPEPGNGAPSALQAALAAAFGVKDVGDFSAIENVNFKH